MEPLENKDHLEDTHSFIGAKAKSLFESAKIILNIFISGPLEKPYKEYKEEKFGFQMLPPQGKGEFPKIHCFPFKPPVIVDSREEGFGFQMLASEVQGGFPKIRCFRQHAGEGRNSLQ